MPAFNRFTFNVVQKRIEIELYENKRFESLEWINSLGKENEEILSVMGLEENGDICCMLRFLGLSLVHHECNFSHEESEFPLFHEIHLKYDSMERVDKRAI